MKILYVATIGGFMPFFKSLVKQLIEDGNEVDFAANQSSSQVPEYYKEWGCKVFDISCSRSPFSLGNIKAIKQIRALAKNYDIVHCHTPLAGMSTRFACRKLRKQNNLIVIYTAHGFHFYKGAPLKNWLLFYPIEKLCSRWTDVLITINKDDYAFAKKKMKTKVVEYVPGVGIDTNRFVLSNVDKYKKRDEINISRDAFMILSVGELNKNKNHQIVLRAIAKSKRSNIHYVIAGVGDQLENLNKLASELGVHLHLLGYRSDVIDLYKSADLYVLPSIREGLNVSIMEAMACNCPVIASKIRGNIDMVPAENCFCPFSENEIVELIDKDKIINSDFVKKIDVKIINQKMKELYGIN